MQSNTTSNNPSCWNCQASLNDAARFCGECGSAQTPVECPQCSGSNPPNSRFCTNCGNKLIEDPQIAPESHADHKESSQRAERRQITVMFSDLVDSTRLVETLDPEDVRLAIQTYQRLCKGLIQDFGGKVTEYLGDGIVVHFTGYENNGERAVLAAMGIIDRMRNFESPLLARIDQPFAVRIGIATGLAIVGDMSLDSERNLNIAVGVPPNLAKRVQGLAEPNQIMIGDKTRELVSGLFKLKDKGEHELKGFAKPERVWRVIGRTSTESRFEAQHSTNLTPMVDRFEVMELLMRRWHQAELGEGQVVILPGEAGIGKSRIVQELRQRVGARNHFRLRYQCSPYHINSAFYPIIERTARAASFLAGDTATRKLDKLETLLQQSGCNTSNSVPVHAAVMSIPNDGRYAENFDTLLNQKDRVYDTLVELPSKLSETRPVLAICEDVHWVDPSSMELMERVAHAAAKLRMLMVVTTRPGTKIPFADDAHISVMPINRLVDKYAKMMVDQVIVNSVLPPSVVETIVTRTDGVPLYIEELSKTVLLNAQPATQSGVDNNPENEIAERQQTFEVPASIQDSLMARLDQLAPETRYTAQTAAAIGREFSFDIVCDVVEQTEESVRNCLGELVAQQLVFRKDGSGNETYIFKHALVRDIAYESLLQKMRPALHQRIVGSIERLAPHIVSGSPEIVATHAILAEQIQKAIAYWLIAGKRASSNSANLEAIASLRAALDAIATLAPGQERDLQELEVLVVLGPVLMIAKGPGSAETENTYKRAVTLCEQLPESELHFAVYWGRWRASSDLSVLHGAVWADKLVDLSTRLNDTGLLLQAHHCQWGTLYNLGRQQECCEHIDKGISLYDPNEHVEHASLYGGHDPLVCAHGEAALSQWLRGHNLLSSEHMQKAMDWTIKLDHIGSTLHAYDYALVLSRFTRNGDQIETLAKKIYDISQELGLPDYEAKSYIFRGWAKGLEGDVAAGLEQLKHGITMQIETGTQEDMPVYREMLAHLYSMQGNHEAALADLEIGIAEAKELGTQYWDAELNRRKGLLLAAINPKDLKAAEHWFYRAIAISQQQDAKALELRSTMNLARSFVTRGNTKPADALLSSMLQRFGKHEDSLDLRTAHSFLQTIQNIGLS